MTILQETVDRNLAQGRRPFEGVVLQDLVMTCHACPSQWDGHHESNGDVYIRFRHGGFGVYSPFEREVYGTGSLGDGPYDGFLSTEDMLAHTGFIVLAGEHKTDNQLNELQKALQELRKQRLQVAKEADLRPKGSRVNYGSTSNAGKRPKFAAKWGRVGTHQQAKVPGPKSSRVSFSVDSAGVVHFSVAFPLSFTVKGSASLAYGAYHPAEGRFAAHGVDLGNQREAYLAECKKRAPKAKAPLWHPTKGDRPGRPLEVWQQAKEAT